MVFLDFGALGWVVNIALFTVAAVVVWIAGVKLAACAKVIAERTGVGRAVVGILAYAGAPVLDEVDRFSLLATLVGILLTGVYLAGIAERRHKAVFGMGLDSLVVPLAYASGLVVLFFVR